MANWLLSIINPTTLVVLLGLVANAKPLPKLAADKTEIAGLEILVMDENKAFNYQLVINEYLGEQLAVQHFCRSPVDSAHRGDEIKCYNKPGGDLFEGAITFAALKQIKNYYLRDIVLGQYDESPKLRQTLSVYLTSRNPQLTQFAFTVRRLDDKYV